VDAKKLQRAKLGSTPFDADKYKNRPELPRRWRDPYHPEKWAQRLKLLLVASPLRDETQLEKYRRAHFDGDPLADELVQWMHRVGMRHGWAEFDKALTLGLHHVADPSPELQAFFEAVDRIPGWLDQDALRRACDFGLRQAIFTQLSEFSGLLAGYAVAGLAKPLVATRSLDDVAAKRIAETVSFVRDIYMSQTLARHSQGFYSTIRVRMLHALVRHNLLKAGWDTDHWGIPINQLDMAATLLGFSASSMMARRLMGCLITPREGADFMHLWRYVGTLLGVDEWLIPTTELAGIQLMPFLVGSQQGPDEDCKGLARALLGTIYTRWPQHVLGRLMARAEISFRVAMTRYIAGNVHCDALDLPKAYLWRPAPLLLAPLIFGAELFRHVVPGMTFAAVRFGDRWLERDVRGRMKLLGRERPAYERGKI
jgi:hypothetical protein